jgi:uncharacterized protein (DUF2141 family)
LAFIAASGGALAQPAAENVIHVDVAGLRNGKGQVLCSLYSSAEAFPRMAIKPSSKSNRRSQIVIVFVISAALGRAPMRLRHSMTRTPTANWIQTLLAYPVKAWGASNDAQGRFGPPPFDKAAFRFTGGHLELKITLHYL